MLVVFPLGLLGFDAVQLLTGNGYWSEIAYWPFDSARSASLVAGESRGIDPTSLAGYSEPVVFRGTAYL